MSKADEDEGRRVWDTVCSRYFELSLGCLLSLQRAYRAGYLTKPLEECTDQQLLHIWGIGQKRLREIREIAPRGFSIPGENVSAP